MQKGNLSKHTLVTKPSHHGNHYLWPGSVSISRSNSHEGRNSHAALYNANNEENNKKVFEKHKQKKKKNITEQAI
jgi:hypothetical protein